MMNNYDLWKYFSDDAVEVKDKLWTISIWLFALLGSLVCFIAKKIPEKSFVFEQPVLILAVAGIGIIMSLYAYWMITSYGEHIRTSWNRTDYLRRLLPELDEAWKHGYANYPPKTRTEEKEENTPQVAENKTGKNKNPNEYNNGYTKTDDIPPFVTRIRWLAKGFLFLFISMAFVAILLLFKN